MASDELFDVVAQRQYSRCFDLGATLSIHRHIPERKLHAHILFDLGWWFVEFRIGADGFKPDAAGGTE